MKIYYAVMVIVVFYIEKHQKRTTNVENRTKILFTPVSKKYDLQ